MYHASCYRKYISPKSLDSVAIANKENAQSPSDHSTTDPNDSYQTWHGLQTSWLNDWGVDHWCCFLYYEYELCHMAECTTLNLVRTKFKVVHSARCQNHLDVLEALYIRTKHANLVSTKRIVHVHVPSMWQVTARSSTGKNVRRYSLRARVTWSKGTLTWDWSFTDLTSVQSRSMCSAVKYSRGQLLRDVWGWTRHKKEKKRVGDEMVCFDELSRSGVLEETQHVYNAALILRCAIQSAPAHHPVSSWAYRSADGLMKRKSMHMFQVSCTIFSHG